MIEVDISKCTGCRMCETACSFYHTGQTNRLLARINVLNQYETGIDGPALCVQCKERYCTDCPENAISIGPYGQIILSGTVCSLCRKCEKNCPVGAIEYFDDHMYVCDLCGGTPRCVEACTEQAIIFVPEKSETISLSKIKDKTKAMNVSEKRIWYISQAGAELRKTWRAKNA